MQRVTVALNVTEEISADENLPYLDGVPDGERPIHRTIERGITLSE